MLCFARNWEKLVARILIVDDDKTLLTFTSDVLQKYAKQLFRSDWELKIHTATNALTALDLIKYNCYELVITDVLMAKMDGWEFIQEIRKRFPQFVTPIVVMSAIDGVELEYQSVKHGACGWVSKPLHPKEFAAKMFGLIQER